MMIVFTDLDGTLLDQSTYSYEPAEPALSRLRALRIPLVFVTSKTLGEVELWRRNMNNDSPFIIENGAAVFAPPGNPPLTAERVRRCDGYDMVELGVPYQELTSALKRAARETGCRIKGFSDMTVHEVARACDLTEDVATLAKSRQYDEPFLLLKGEIELLRQALERRRLLLTQGGRFYHVTGHTDKAEAVLLLIEAYRHFGVPQTIGIGDGPNDSSFLNLVDYPVLIDSPAVGELRKRVPRARLASAGPAGWNRAVLEILDAA